MVRIFNNYLRNADEYPLSYSGRNITGLIVNPQPGKCNHFSIRHDDGKPLYIVQHHTVASFDETIEIFTSRNLNQKQVSTHYVINTDGTIYKLVDPQYKAYHAGVGNISTASKWHHKDLPTTGIVNNMNNWSIGIENVNLGTEKFTDVQKKANILLCEHLCNEYNIDPQFIIGHADWSPGRKIDPSPYFFWKELSRAQDLYHEEVTRNFGIYPKNDLVLKHEPEIILSYDFNNTDTMQVTEIQNKLKSLYTIDDGEGVFGPDTINALLSFRIHFSGEDIIESPCQMQAWENLCIDNTVDNRKFLGICTENDLARLDNILEHT